MEKNTLSHTEQKRLRREYRRTHPNGRVYPKLDERDRALIKEFCKRSGGKYRATISLERNSCIITSTLGTEELFIGSIQKIVYKDSFFLLEPFKLYINRNPKPGESGKFRIIPAGTLITVSENKQYFCIPIDDCEEPVYVERFIIAKSANTIQMFSLFLVNEKENIGPGEGQLKIDLVRILKNNKLDTSKQLVTNHEIQSVA